MRQKNVIWVLALVIITAIAAISVFTFIRQPDSANTLQHEHELHESDSIQEQRQINMDSSDLEPSGTIEDDVRVIEVKARQFEFEPEMIIVKEGESVRLEVTSEDVTHGLKIAEYDINRQLKPDKTETIDFTADQPGSFTFRCSVYCGEGHAEMKGELVVLAKD